MRLQNFLLALLIATCISAHSQSQTIRTLGQVVNTPGESIGQADSSSVVLASLESELAINEGILRYEMGDYNGAMQSFAPLANSSPIAAQYCELCTNGMAESGGVYISDEYAPATESMFGAGGPRDLNQQPNRQWNFTVLTGYQYDSNVSVSPEFIGLGAITDKSDSSWYVASFGDLRLVEESDLNVGVVMSTYNNFYFQQTAFDLQDYMGGAYVNKVLAPNVIGGVRYEYHKTLLNDNEFSSEHRLVPNLSFLRGDYGHATVYYEYDSIKFDDQPLIQALDPSSETSAVGVTLAQYTWGGSGRLYAGYRYENVSATGSDFDRDGHQVNGRFEVPVNCKLIWDGGVRYFWDNFENANSLDFNGDVREDERVEVRTGLQMMMNQHLSTRVDYTFTETDSNVENLFGVKFFEYARHNLTAQVIIDF